MQAIEKVIPLTSRKEVAAPNPEAASPPPKDVEKREPALSHKIEEVHAAIEKNLEIDNFKLNFSVDSETHRVVVRILDAETGEVIREVPPSEVLELAKEIEELRGILFNENV